MKIRRPESEIDPEDPFKDDLLERKGRAIQLVNFVSRVSGPLTVALTGAYGSGKTHFLRRCKVLMEKKGIPTLLMNAWETDFASEPISPIITELSDQFAGRLGTKDRNWNKAKKLAGKVAAASVPLVVKVVTAGILKIEDFSEASTLADAAEKIAQNQIDQFAAARKSIAGLKAELRQLTDLIRGIGAGEDAAASKAPVPPVVVLIDELDRCRPTYAIELLEVLKHLFDIPGIVFVLAIDRTHLVSAAQAVFGSGLDGDGYLRKFIDLECSLPQPDVVRFCYNLDLDRLFPVWRERQCQKLLVNLAHLCQDAGFSLRKAHQFLVRTSIALSASDNIGDLEDVGFLVFLREYDRELYHGFVTGKVTSWELLVRLRSFSPSFCTAEGHGEIPFATLLAAAGRKQSPEPFLDLLERDLQKTDQNIRLDYLRGRITGNWTFYLKCLLPPKRIPPSF